MKKNISLKKVTAAYVLLFVATAIYTNFYFSLDFWQATNAFLYGLLPNGFVLVVTIWLTNIFSKYSTNRGVFVAGALTLFVLLWTLSVFIIMPSVYYYIGEPWVAYFSFWAPIVWIISVFYYAFKT